MLTRLLAADGTPLKRSLARALRMQKMRALMLIAPLLVFVLLSFIVPIVSMLFRSVENEIVENTLPYTTEQLAQWDGTTDQLPGDPVFQALYFDMFLAAELKRVAGWHSARGLNRRLRVCHEANEIHEHIIAYDKAARPEV